MLHRRAISSVWLLAMTSACALAFAAWQIASTIPLRERPRGEVAIPVRASLALEMPPDAERVSARLSNEECWARFHVDVPVVEDVSLLARLDEACRLPVLPREDAPPRRCNLVDEPRGTFDIIELGDEPRGTFDARASGTLVLTHGRGDGFTSYGVELHLERSAAGVWSASALAYDASDVVDDPELDGRSFWTHVTGRVELGCAEWRSGAPIVVRYELRRPNPIDDQVRTGLVCVAAP